MATLSSTGTEDAWDTRQTLTGYLFFLGFGIGAVVVTLRTAATKVRVDEVGVTIVNWFTTRHFAPGEVTEFQTSNRLFCGMVAVLQSGEELPVSVVPGDPSDRIYRSVDTRIKVQRLNDALHAKPVTLARIANTPLTTGFTFRRELPGSGHRSLTPERSTVASWRHRHLSAQTPASSEQERPALVFGVALEAGVLPERDRGCVLGVHHRVEA
jgi:hypothetical protein